jgi:predicted secreted hydrolase
MVERRAGYRLWATGVVAIGLTMLITWWLFSRGVGHHSTAESASPDFGNLVDFLASPTEVDFDQVVRGRRFSFPADHGAHPGFRQEWWYFTGRLETSVGREFGYQLTFFRFAGSQADQPDSAWSASQSWMAHLAVTDVAGGRFYRAEDFSRGALDLAGAKGDPFTVWVNGWSVDGSAAGRDCPGCFTATMAAENDDVALSLQLRADQPPVLQGEDGYSMKTADGRAASYYYSMPGIATGGSLTVDGESFEISGESWMDREWSSAVLTPGQSGWDWFSLNLDNDQRFTLFQVRESGAPPHVSVSLIDSQGQNQSLDPAGISLTPLRYWTSNETGARYPVEWQIQGRHPAGDWQLEISPVMDSQEMALAFRYYEGLVKIEGVWAGEPVKGWGYMELTGYGSSD